VENLLPLHPCSQQRVSVPAALSEVTLLVSRRRSAMASSNSSRSSISLCGCSTSVGSRWLSKRLIESKRTWSEYDLDKLLLVWEACRSGLGRGSLVAS
jgi:hypothetical protein